MLIGWRILDYLIMIEYPLNRINKLSLLSQETFYATSSCSIKTKNSAKQSPGKTSVTIGVKIGGKNAAVILYLYFY